jgi:hypothetical protein
MTNDGGGSENRSRRAFDRQTKLKMNKVEFLANAIVLGAQKGAGKLSSTLQLSDLCVCLCVF